jgi:site-specific DNA-methyltransferase (adenine-specific)
MKLLLGDCLDKLKELEANSVDSIVTDPPYGLAFMGKKWDYDVPSQAIWEECLRVLKPGGHILSFAGSRTYHRMAVRIEDAGFEIRDQIMWIYGSGFPKSHNVGNAIDKKHGAGNRGHAISSGNKFHPTTGEARPSGELLDKYEARTEEGKGWEGWGTALKPAHEPIVMARKPLVGTVADNVLEWGVGGINIDGCRVGTDGGTKRDGQSDKVTKTNPNLKPTNSLNRTGHGIIELNEGRFPANIILECTCENPKVKDNTNTPYNYNDNEYKVDGFITNIKPNAPSNYNDTNSGVIHTDPNCPCYILDGQSGKSKSSPNKWEGDNNAAIYGKYEKGVRQSTFSDEGGASRFFYCPKASKKDRNEGCDELEEKMSAHSVADKCGKCGKFLVASANICKCEEPERVGISNKNNHPTVKPTDLMAYLIRLVTPKGGIVLDPFMGSGSTGKAAVIEGMEFIGIEREEEYYEIAKQRIENETNKRKFF